MSKLQLIAWILRVGIAGTFIGHGMFAFYSIMGAMMAFWGLMTIKDNRGKSLIKVEESYESKDCKA